MAILDQHGRPIDSGLLKEPQTARLGSLHQEFSTHPSRGLTPAKLARILQQAEQGDLIAQCDLFEDMEEKDAHIFAEMSKRKRALQTVDWIIVEPPGASAAEKKDADYLREILAGLPDFEDIIFDALDAIGKGYSCQEIEWQRVERDWLPGKVEHRPPSWFKVMQSRQNELRLRDNSVDGAELQPFGWIVHTHKGKSGYLARGGLHRVLAWPYLFKIYSVRDLAELLEIYGLPLRLGTYPAGASDTEKATLLRAVVAIGHNAAGIIPEGMAIDFKEASAGTNAPHNAMIEWCEKSESKAILGGTLTSQADGKSSTNALGNVHNEVRHDLKKSDGRQLGVTLTQYILYPLLALNRGGVPDRRRMPRLEFDLQEPEDLKLYADALPKFVDMGMRIGVGYAHEKLRIPVATNDEPVLVSAKTNTAERPATAAQRALAALRAGGASAATDGQAVIDALALPDAVLQAQAEKLLAPVLDLVRGGADYKTISDKLAELFPDLDTAGLEELLARAIFVGDLWGQATADEDAPAA